MQARSAAFYDAIYAWKDYPAEVARLYELLSERDIAEGTWLDVACGTGKHLALLSQRFQTQGLERDPAMIQLARERLPGTPMHEADMRDFELGQKFEVVSCLFSSIGYLTEPEDLDRALLCMARHLSPNGVLVIEPWFFPHQFIDGFVGGDFYSSDDLKIARVARNWTEGPISVMEMHHLVGTPGQVESFVETHRMGLYTDYEYRQAFARAGLDVVHDPEGLMGRGLYLATLRQGDRKDDVAGLEARA